MKLTGRDFDVLNYIVKNQEITINTLQKMTNLSQITIKKSIANINSFLKNTSNFQLTIDSSIIKFPLEKKEVLESICIKFFKHSHICKNERVNYICLKIIFENTINISKIANELEVTRLTIFKDLEDVKKILSAFNLFLKSIPWKGIALEGKAANILDFSIKFIIHFHITKANNYYLSDIYNSLINPRAIEYLSQYLPLKLEKEFRSYAKKIFNRFDLKPSLYSYETFTVVLFFINLKKNNQLELLNDIDKHLKNLPYRDLAEEYFQIIKKENLIDTFSLEDSELYLLVEVLLNIDYRILDCGKNFSPYLSFLENVEKKLNLNLNKKEKFHIVNILVSSKFKKIFDSIEYEPELKNRNLSYSVVFTLLEDDLKKLNEILTSESLFYLINFLKELYLQNLHQSKNVKNIFIIDSSLNSLHGNILKKQLITSYCVGTVEVSGFLDTLNYDYINNNFDLIFFIDTFFYEAELFEIKKFEFSFIYTQSFDFELIGLMKKI